MLADVVEIMRGDPWFAGLPVELQTDLQGIALIKHIKARTRLFSRGDAPSGLYGLLAGSLWVFSELEPGSEGLLTPLHAPAWFGEVGLFDGLCRTHNVEAGTDCTLLYLPQTLLTRLLEQKPHYWRYLALLLTQKLRWTFLALDELVRASVEVRLARRLIFASMGLGSLSATRDSLELSQETLAQMVGMSRASISPVLRQFKARGLVRLAYGRIHILDMAELKKVADVDNWLPTTKMPDSRLP
ncbi:Crp/Fnr family transcriptional regulator [Aquabacterium sp. NJ1]|uniref:Crp/Fnr family transcriptional regulator n=1 Tax=Aquabacterium sp. NJ1 TaxID=1538295 RepID=UPI00068948CC|nr:Crp/Fnr family transcriptional regulator [Aquabacterium sp. NJ1]